MSVSLPPGLASFRPPSPIPRELSPSPIPALPSFRRSSPISRKPSPPPIPTPPSRAWRDPLARYPYPWPAPPSPSGDRPVRVPKAGHSREQRETPAPTPKDSPSEPQDPTSPSRLPELVRDARLDTTVQGTTTIHRRIVRRRGALQEERWIRHTDNILGHGGGGLVWLEHKVPRSETDPSERRAVKAIRVPGGRPITEGLHYVRELEALAKFSQERYAEFFVRFAGWYEVPNYLCISMEYCEHGDLKRYLESAKTIPEDEARDVASQVLCALAMMHQEGFAHRDVKPANILIKSKPPDGWWVKVCDLGLTKRAEDITGSTTVRGTPGFWAPETLGFNGHPQLTDARPTDMWCFGETVFQMLAGHPTFESLADLHRYDTGLRTFPLEALDRVHASNDAQHFVQTLMAADPSRRPSAQATQGHSWIRPSAQAVDDYASSKSAVPTSNQAEGAWPPNMPTRHPEEFTQASGQWTGTVTMQGRMRSAAVYPAASFAHPVYGHAPAGQAGVYPPFSPVNGYENGGMRPQMQMAIPPRPFFFNTAIPWDSVDYLKSVASYRAAYRTQDPKIDTGEQGTVPHFPPGVDAAWNSYNPTVPTAEVDRPMIDRASDRRPAPGSSPEPSDLLAGRAVQAREKDNSLGSTGAPSYSVPPEILSKLNETEMTLRAMLVDIQRDRLEPQQREADALEALDMLHKLSRFATIVSNPPGPGTNEEWKDNSKVERSEDKTAEGPRAISKTLGPGVPGPRFHSALPAKEAREKTSMLGSARDISFEELRAFSKTFQLRTPVYNDLKRKLAKGLAKHQELVAKQESILSPQQEEAAIPPRLQADKAVPSEAPALDQTLPSARAMSTEEAPTFPVEAQDPSIDAARPGPYPPFATTKTCAAVAAAGEGQAAGTAGQGDGHQLPLKKAKKDKRRKKRGGPMVPESRYDEIVVWPDYID